MKIKNSSIKSLMFIVSSLGTGGAERVVSELANYYLDKGIDVYILLISNDKVRYNMNEKVQIINMCNEVNQKSGFFAMLHRLKLIRNYADQFKPTIVFSFLSVINMYTCLALGLSRHKIIISERNDPRQDPRDRIKRIVRVIIYRLANGYVFQTEMAQKYFSKKIQRKSVIISNPIKAGLPEPFNGIRSKRMVAIGRLEKQKNYSLLIEAFNEIQKELNDYVLDIYGEGKERKSIESMIYGLGLENKITLHGNVSNVHEVVLDASIYILSSNYEGMPNALMEAMALGIPSISSDCPCGGPAILIKDGVNGLLFPVGNKKVLIDRIRNVILNGDISEEISLNAVRIRKTYELQHVAEQWLSFAKKICRVQEKNE